MNFIGEHLLPGQLGHFFTIFAFVSSLIAVFAYRKSTTALDALQSDNWKKLGRYAFYAQAISAFVIFGIVYYICSNHYYEYLYVYKHASLELEPKYLLACIWEGQEGSFLLWALCQSIIGLLFLLGKNSPYESRIMMVLSIAQVFFFLMILGIYVGDIRLGNNLFVLTRNELEAPIFSRPNYLDFIKDGMGLNVLLRNYWMVIHPPFLFLGFASSIMPFAYAYSGIKCAHKGDWVKPAMFWTLLCTAILGTGIMMGGKWAYESLSFGGYWAWDPVENASLVPWLILIAGLHAMIIYLYTGRALRASYLFSFLGFSFVLYSTFLTRTGILGDTSVHSFTEAGSAINIMIGVFVLSFFLLGMVSYIRSYKQIPTVLTEESSSSREFWLFIGSIVIFLAAIFIIGITSIPVYNQIPFVKSLIIKMHGGPLAMPEDPEFLYNKTMAMVAIILGVLTAIAQYFKYKQTPKGFTLKKIALPTFLSAVVTTAIVIAYPLQYAKQGPGFLVALYLGLFSMLYAVIANGWYLATIQKRNWKAAGGSIAHMGFALMIVGMIISSSNKKVISSSLVNGITFEQSKDPRTGKWEDPQENLTLLRQVPTKMERYEVTYLKDSLGNEKGRKFYQLQFVEKNADKQVKNTFYLYPDVYLMKDNNMSSNPDIKTNITHDIFTYVSYALKEIEPSEDTTAFHEIVIGMKDTGYFNNGYIVLNDVIKNPSNSKYQFKEDDLALMADVTVVAKDSTRYRAMPALEVDHDHLHHLDDTLYAPNIYVRFIGMKDNESFRIGIKESDKLVDFVTVKTYVFPYINLVWAGLIIMIMGICIAMINRAGYNKTVRFILLVASALFLTFLFLFANN